MVSKVTFGLGLGVGYVLGTKAGREKFDQLMTSSRHAWQSEPVQNAKGVAQHQGAKLYDDGKHAVNDRLNRGDVSESDHISRKPDQTLAGDRPPRGDQF
jgi:hypothetical protein